MDLENEKESESIGDSEKVPAIVVYRKGQKSGVVLEKDSEKFLESLFAQPEGAGLALVRVDVNPKDYQDEQ